MPEKLLTNISVACIYAEDKFGSETTTQSLMGEELTVLESGKDWIKVRQHDEYEGWIPRGSVAPKPEGWDEYPHFSPRSQVVWIHENPDSASATIRDMTLLSKLPSLDQSHGWVQLLLPDGQTGWVNSEPRFTPNQIDVEALSATALQFQGIQYQWGGRSPKGFDCSGFVQSVFALHGMPLPRDAYLQAQFGQEVDPDWHSWEPGDLIFFAEKPEKITHVALSLGGSNFIHASGFVKINTLDPADAENFVPKYHDIYTMTKRVI